MSEYPIRSEMDIEEASRLFHSVNLDLYSLFDRKTEGEWRTQLIGVNLSDDSNVQLQYNAYDDIVFVKNNHTQVSFTYTNLSIIQFKVTTEEENVQVRH